MAKAKNSIRAVQKALSIVEVLRDTCGARVTEIADTIDTSKGTVHCHLATLEENGYVVKQGNEYKLGLKFIDLAHHA